MAKGRLYMLQIINPSLDPYFNLALEDYLVHNPDIGADLLILWQNQPAVVVGRHQNSEAEINLPFIREKGIAVVRRLSGGGAVYHDRGNLNFTLITEATGRVLDFAAFTVPVIETLQQLGIPAEHTGRNDILIRGRKFSGNAQYRYKNRLMHHGTILFDSNLDDMARALQVDESKTVARGIASVRSRVTNIMEHLSEPVGLEDFQEMLVKNVFRCRGLRRQRVLSPAEIKAVQYLSDSKYRSWAWNYGRSPQYSQRRKRQFPWGSMEALLLVKKGQIVQCSLCGDFFTIADISTLEKALLGQPLQGETIEAVLTSIDPAAIIPGATVAQIMGLLIE